MFEALFHTLRHKSFRDVSVVYVGSFVNNVALFATNLVLARSISQDAFGVFGLVLSVLGAVADFSDFGLNAAFLRFASFYHGQRETNKLMYLVKLIWGWRLGLSFAVTICGLFVSGVLAHSIYHEATLTPYLRLAFLGVGGVILSTAIGVYLQATERFFVAAVANGVKGGLRLLVVGVLLVSGVTNLLWLLLAYITIPWLVMFGTLSYLPKNFTHVIFSQKEASAIKSKLFSFSVWVMVWSFLTIISSRVEQTFLSRYLTLKDVAIYSVGMQLIAFYTYMLQSMTTVLSPKMNAKGSVAEIQTLLRSMYRKIIPLVVVLAVCIYPTKFFIPLLFGPEYVSSMAVYVITSYGILLNFVVLPWSLMISALNATKALAVGGVLQLFVSLGGNIFLIPRFGVIGAASAFFCTIFVMNVYTVIAAEYMRRKRQHVEL